MCSVFVIIGRYFSSDLNIYIILQNSRNSQIIRLFDHVRKK